MSLDTVLQIGKALRESPDGLKDFQYVRSCPEDTDNETILRISIPVNDDFTFDWENVYEIKDENRIKKLFYLKFKTSENDSTSKYMFGDVYHIRSSKITSKGYKTTGSGFLLNNPDSKGFWKQNSFERAEDAFEDIRDNFPDSSGKIKRFRDNFKNDYEIIERILKYIPGIEKFLEEKAAGKTSKKFDEFITNLDKVILNTAKKNFGSIQRSRNSSRKFNAILAEKEPKWEEVKQSKSQLTKLAEYSSGNIYLHFEFSGGNHWYQFEETFKTIKRQIFDDFVDKSKNGNYVLKKTLFKTICSGNKKNDIQFPGFNSNSRHKNKSFTQDQLEDLFYAIEYSEKGLFWLYGTDLKIIVLPKGENLQASDFKDFFSNGDEIVANRRNSDNQGDNFFIALDASDFTEKITSFDMVLTRRGQNREVDLVELRGVQKSSLKQIKGRIWNIKKEIYKRRQAELNTEKNLRSFSITNSFQQILGAPENNNGNVKFRPNPEYESHLLKVIPKIYTGNYFLDPILLPALIENVEFSVRAGDPKFIWLKYDFEFLLSIQNTEPEKKHLMDIQNSTSYKVGLLLGKMARNFAGEKSPIKSYEKNYVGNLTRRIGNLNDLIEFKNDLEEKLVIHEKIKFVRSEAAELAQQIKKLSEGEYEKNLCAFGFFETYFKPFQGQTFIKKIEKHFKNYKSSEDVDVELIEDMEEILTTHKPKK